MRHLIGVGLAILMAAAVFFGGAWGYLRLLRLPGPAGSLAALPAGGGSLTSNHQVLLAFGALTGTALLAGLLIAVPWFSPLGSGLPGLVLIAWSVVYVLGVHRAVSLIPLRTDAFGAGFEAMLFNGVLAAGGIAMIIPLFVPSRWRGQAGAGPGYSSPGSDTGLLQDWAETGPLPPVPGGGDEFRLG